MQIVGFSASGVVCDWCVGAGHAGADELDVSLLGMPLKKIVFGVVNDLNFPGSGYGQQGV